MNGQDNNDLVDCPRCAHTGRSVLCPLCLANWRVPRSVATAYALLADKDGFLQFYEIAKLTRQMDE